MYLVKETTVCPGGYRSYRDKDDSGKRCGEPIKYDQLKELSYLGVSLAKSVPPEKIPLDEISKRLSEYSRYDCPLEDPCEDPNKRWSIVLAFEFQMKDPKGETVTLQRIVPESIIEDYFKEFPQQKVNVKVEDTLDFGGRWLHHQRADLFLPGHKVEWRLTAGSYCWKFGTKFVNRETD